MANKNQKSGLETRLEKKILGRLVCFDRILVNGTLQRLQNPAAIAGMLHDSGLDAFDLKEFALPLTQSVRDNARALAEANGLPIEFVADRKLRKEDIARQYLEERGSDKPGLVCVLSAIENCSSFAPRKAGGKHKLNWIKPVGGRCTHYYFYFLDATLGLMHVRVPTWIPFRLQFNFNGHGWLAGKLDAAGVSYTREDNAFTRISDWGKAGGIAAAADPRELEKILGSYAEMCCPPCKEYGRHYLSISQAEVALDIAFRDGDTLLPTCERLCREAMLTVRAADVARYFGKRLSPEGEATSYYRTITEGMYCVRHHLGKQALKTYNKGSVLRVENTCADPTFYRHYRKVEKRDGTSEMKTAPLRKQLGSLHDLFELMSRGCERYLEQLSLLEDPDTGREDLDKLSRPERDRKGRSWRGFNLFLRTDLDLVTALHCGEGYLSGFTNKLLRARLGGRYNSGQVGRMLRRLREHGLIKKVSNTFRYYLTERGKRALLAALKIREHVVIPVLQPAT